MPLQYPTSQQLHTRQQQWRFVRLGIFSTFQTVWIKRPTRYHFKYYVYFSFIGCSTCFGPPCAHLQELTTCSYLSDVLQSRGCPLGSTLSASQWTDQQPTGSDCLHSHGSATHLINNYKSSAPEDGHKVARNMLSNI